MPKKGYKAITVKKALADRITELARQLDKTVPDVIVLAVDDYEKKLERAQVAS